jgi:hypothetical protein
MTRIGEVLLVKSDLTVEGQKAIDFAMQVASWIGKDLTTFDYEALLTSDGTMKPKEEINRLVIEFVPTVIDKVIPADLIAKIERDSMQLLSYRKNDLLTSRNDAAYQAKNAMQVYNSSMDRYHRANIEIAALETMQESPFIAEYRKCFEDTFWKFELYDEYRKELHLVTRNPVIMSGTHRETGTMTVDFGKFVVTIPVANRRMPLVLKYSDNILVAGYYHTYISDQGSICWGNASDTAHELLCKGLYSELLKLLAANLTCFAFDSTPYLGLGAFKDHIEKHGRTNQRKLSCTNEWCEECDEERAHCDCGDWCSNCDGHYGDCGCYVCEICDDRTDEPCEFHYCHICSSYSRHPSECCCSDCENSRDNCTCCSICSGTDRESCGCCHDCEQTANDIERRGHAADCPNNSDREE